MCTGHRAGHGFGGPLLRSYVLAELYIPTLTGFGANSHLLSKIDRITLATHIKDVTNMLFYEDLSDVVLVGNSYGGMVFTGVAAEEPRRLAHLVYLDAYIPLEGENEMVLWPPDEKARVRAEMAKGNKFRPLPPNFPAFVGITDSKLAEWVQERLTPHPISSIDITVYSAESSSPTSSPIRECKSGYDFSNFILNVDRNIIQLKTFNVETGTATCPALINTRGDRWDLSTY